MEKVYIVMFQNSPRHAYIYKVFANREHAEKFIDDANALQQTDDDPDVREAHFYLVVEDVLESL